MNKMQRKIALAAVLGSLQGVAALAVAWLLKTMVDLALGDNTDISFSTLCVISAGYYLCYLILYHLSKKSFFGAIRSIRIGIKKRLFFGLLWENEDKHKKHDVGSVLSEFQQQLDILESDYYTPLITLVSHAATIAVSVVALLVVQWYAIPICAVLLCLYFLMTRHVKARLEALRNQSIALCQAENAELVTLVSSFHTARDYGQETFFARRYQKRIAAYGASSRKISILYAVLAIISQSLNPLLTLLLLVGGGILLKSGSGITMGQILGVTELVGTMVVPIGSIGALMGQMNSTRQLRKNFAEREQGGIDDRDEWMPKQDLAALREITLHQVDFGYDESQLLENVNLRLMAGKKYAIVGKSGSGKTTLLKILLKQIEPQSGSVSWNSERYSDIRKADLLTKIGYVRQSPTIFHKSIGDNITTGRNPDEERLQRAIDQSGLSAIGRSTQATTEFTSLYAPDLSGGEKKRVAYARALYKGCDVLLLDEFTSALSAESSRALEKDMLRNSQHLIIHVTHTLTPDTAALYDGIIRVSDTKVDMSDSEL